jgi:hypothetical protein
MKVPWIFIFTTVLFLSVAFAQQHTDHAKSAAKQTQQRAGEGDGKPGVVTGYVRDVACLLRNPQAGVATSAHAKQCMRQCVRDGSPIAILSEEGALYTPISEGIPDKSVRAQLLPYIGKYVRARGKVFQRGDMHAISITEIEVIEMRAGSKIPAA